jgi:hypothetical protein
MEPQINYSDEFQPTSGKQGSKPEKGSKVAFPNRNQSSRIFRKLGSHKEGTILGGAMPLKHILLALNISYCRLFFLYAVSSNKIRSPNLLLLPPPNALQALIIGHGRLNLIGTYKVLHLDISSLQLACLMRLLLIYLVLPHGNFMLPRCGQRKYEPLI